MKDLPKFGCDVHKDCSVFRSQDAQVGLGPPVRAMHKNGELDRYLMTLPAGAAIAVEACGCWMWVVGRLEAAGLVLHLADPGKTKKRMAGSTRTEAGEAAVVCGGDRGGGDMSGAVSGANFRGVS